MDRRSALRLTATTLAGLLFSPGRVAHGAGSGPEMTALSAYMGAAGARVLPEQAAERAKHHLLDTLAAMISGSELLPGQMAHRYIRAHGGRGAATIAGSQLT